MLIDNVSVVFYFGRQCDSSNSTKNRIWHVRFFTCLVSCYLWVACVREQSKHANRMKYNLAAWNFLWTPLSLFLAGFLCSCILCLLSSVPALCQAKALFSNYERCFYVFCNLFFRLYFRALLWAPCTCSVAFCGVHPFVSLSGARARCPKCHRII